MRHRFVKVLAALMTLVMILTACTAANTPDSSSSSGAKETEKSSSAESSKQDEASDTGSEEQISPESSEDAAASDSSEEASSNSSETAEVTPEEIAVDLPNGDLAPFSEVEEGEGADDEEISRIDRVMRDYSPTTTVLVNNSTFFYYYEQLDEEMQNIYDCILMAAQDPSGENYVVYIADEDPSTSSFREKINRSFWAVLFDHAELYWLYASRGLRYKYSTSDTNKNMVYFYVDEYENFEEDVALFNKAVKDFLKDIDTKGMSDTEIARQIHDKLISMVTYDYDLLDKHTYNDIGHTAFGALVHNEDGKKNYAVCDGYTAAFAYLCQQCGVNAIYVCGDAGSDINSMGGHAWNMAYLDGKWYEIDSTWNDFGNKLVNPSVVSSSYYSYYEEMYANSYFMESVQHRLFMVTTKYMNDCPQDSSYDYYTLDGRYIFHMGSASVHRKDHELSSSYDPWVYLMALSPSAD